jgi:MFS transporter, DHA1 family, multidrug resistance protein
MIGRRNFYFIWLSQFFAITGFAFALPFAPYYIQDLGVTDETALKWWVALFGAATPLALAVASPLWGAASDRFGHRLMLLRANFCGAVIMALMGAIQSVESLIVLRLLQGALTGTFTAAQIMVAASVPPNRSGSALGSLNAAVFSGAMVGAALGGWVTTFTGFRAAFLVGGALILLAAFFILFGTEDVPIPDEDAPSADLVKEKKLRRSAFHIATPILLLLLCASFVRQFDTTLMPLLVQEIHGSIEGASMRTGLLFAISGVAGIAANIYLGRLADRVHPSRIGFYSAIGAAIMMVPQGLAMAVWMLYPSRFIMMFCAGGLESAIQIWLAKITPRPYKGLIFGWASTARAIGWVAAPLCSGGIAVYYGIRGIYFVGAVLFLLLVPILLYTLKRRPA